VTNPIVAAGVNGAYNGLFSESGGAAEKSAGLVSSLIVRTNRTYSGRIFLNGRVLGLAGTFNWSGDATTVVKRALYGSSNLSVNMHLDWVDDTRRITGSVSNMDVGDPWVAYMTNDQSGRYTGHDARFTMAIPPLANAPDNSPGGYGYATMTNNALGNISIVGATADGAKVAQIVPVSKGGLIPFHMSLYTNSGVIHGWLDIAGGAPSGKMNWIKTAPSLLPTNYQSGFTNTDVSVIGSGYNPNAYGGRALGLGTVTLTVSNLNIGTDTNLTWRANISVGNLVTRSSGESNLVGGTIIKSTGLLGLKFRPSDAGPVSASNPDRTIQGVVMQNTTNAYGRFNAIDSKTGSAVMAP
jgi:hypothetical protein